MGWSIEGWIMVVSFLRVGTGWRPSGMSWVFTSAGVEVYMATPGVYAQHHTASDCITSAIPFRRSQ